jgi:hypothetical protein
MKMLTRAVRIAGVAAIAAAPAVFVSSGQAVALDSTVSFTTVGTSTFAVPQGVTCVSIDAIGAAGGNMISSVGAGDVASANGAGGVNAADVDGALGGEATSVVAVLVGQTLDINVGGRGGDGVAGNSGGIPGGAGGFNGGGAGGAGTAESVFGQSPGAGGGGASDVRLGGSDLTNRVSVGGGGGGAGGFNGGGAGTGGGEEGGNGGNGDVATGGAGGTQSAGGAGGTTGSDPAVGGDGSLGAGGAGAEGALLNGGGGGGGGGDFGGGGGGGVLPGNGSAAPGGGGSGFGGDLTSGVDAGNGGNGSVTLSYSVGDTSCLAAPLTIKKLTTGTTAAAGTTYTLALTCADPRINPSFGGEGEGVASLDLTFTVDGAGVPQPASGYTVGFGGPTDCTVTETGAGGAASASFECTGAFGANDAAAADWVRATALPDDPCVSNGPVPDSIGVAIEDPGQNATVTVTNTVVAAAVLIAPRFTG